jgi:hypothetical protein
MNNTLYVSTDAELNTILNSTMEFNVIEGAEDYATAPIAVVLPPDQQWSEEELHTSFEQAISGRVTQVHERLSRMSSANIPARRPMPNTDPLVIDGATGVKQSHVAFSGSIWQRSIIFVTLALICIMAGFDLMGLLVLHMMH